MKKLLLLWLLFSVVKGYGQEYFPKNDGVSNNNSNYVAFKNANIIVSSKKTIKNGILLIKKGKIIAVGKKVELPKNTDIIDLKGKFVYPSFIDPMSEFGIVKPVRPPGSGRSTQYESLRKGYYWNEHIMPENLGISSYSYDEKAAKAYQKNGFGAVNTHINDGIVRGTGVLVALNSKGTDASRILDPASAQYLSFRKSVTSQQAYPNSLMGAMALLRQLYLDTNWYANGKSETIDLSIEALIKNKNLPQIFLAEDKLNVLRADRIGDEFGINYTIVGSGNEFELIDEIKNTNATLIIPLSFPDAYDVEDALKTDFLSLSNMRYWNQAPSNPKILAEHDIQFSFTTHGLKSINYFRKNMLKAISMGLDKTIALDALTRIPAKILNKEDQLGSLDIGKQANFIICSGDIFEKETTLFENWVQGEKHVITSKNINTIDGTYQLNIGSASYPMEIAKSATEKPKVTISNNTAKVTYTNDWLSIVVKIDQKTFRLKGKIMSPDFELKGTGTDVNGTNVNWTAVKTAENSTKKKPSKKDVLTNVSPISYPNNGYGFREKPKQEILLFKNVTVWTNEDSGIMQNTDVLIKDGKIAQIGTNLTNRSARVIDGTGKHLTAGIIDEHTHVAATSSNEGGHNSTAEVTMEDTIDYEDINIYRNLGGGVTSMQILHGSANPIGGRSALVKLKWGEIGTNMIYKNSPKFIKFALGENVKQSNWESYSRFPQTRMGVEQVFIDYFQRAKEYDLLKKSGKPFRKDIEMETLAEILNKERFITCHSYVQSEINMLMKVAEKFDFNVNTFTHILEGYKLADKMKEHGVAASTFSDWWAYKYEVNDAIPYNASILHKSGILTAINSDDREMSRRLNQEAAKTVKYGGVSEEEAWKFVTLNPAKMLHIDDRVGSIKVGKDADVVLWSGNPLSIYTIAEKTIIEGTVYYDIERDKALRTAIKKERNQLILQMLNEKMAGNPVQTPTRNVKEALHCDTVSN